MDLPQPKGSSTRLRFCWLISYPEWRVVRLFAESRLVVFWATCEHANIIGTPDTGIV